jgi:hypothetical protein
LPLASAQIIWKVAVATSAPVDALPLGAVSLVHPPTAEHDVAFELVHVRVALWPAVIFGGFGVSTTVGRAVTVTVCVAVALSNVVALVQVIV